MYDIPSTKDHADYRALRGACQPSPGWTYFSFPPFPEPEEAEDEDAEQAVPMGTIAPGMQLPSSPVTKISSREAYGTPSRLPNTRPSEAVASLERVVPQAAQVSAFPPSASDSDASTGELV